MTTATAEPLTLQQAFTQAKEEHSAAAERAPSGEASTERAAATAQPDEAQAQPPATDSAAPEITDLISDEEYSALQTKHAGNTDAVLKELKGVFTKKTQQLAEQRKTVEALAEYAPFITALQSDSKAAIKAAAEQLGLVVTDKSIETTATETATKTAEGMADDVIAGFKQALGPDLDFLADKLAPAIHQLVQNVAKAAVGEAVTPLQTQQQTLLDKAAQEQTDATLKAFTDKRPDWKQHEPAMLKIAEQLKPNGMSEIDYLDTLYTLATKDIAAAEAAKKAVERMTKAAKTDEGKSHPLPGSQVSVARPTSPSIRDAFEAAKRGERWE
ncbi:MAG TPA: hypothetical protein VEC39_17695 [Vicinamibacterales bacterium]|nr:hypothetical protein [Vicinamibacterales bacterium]